MRQYLKSYLSLFTLNEFSDCPIFHFVGYRQTSFYQNNRFSIVPNLAPYFLLAAETIRTEKSQENFAFVAFLSQKNVSIKFIKNNAYIFCDIIISL